MSDHKHTVRLRAHHLLCMHGFQGKGYSDLFVRRLREIIDLLNDDPDQIIEIIHAVDDICLYCPHAGGDGLCDHETKVSDYDEKALDIFGIREGCADFRKLKERVDDDLSAEELYKICPDCQWLDLCLESFKEET